MQRAGFRECELEYTCVSASSQSGSCRVHGAAQLDCIDSQDRDHLGNKYLRNGSCAIHLVPHQSNDYKTTSLLVVLSKHCSVGCSSHCGFEPMLI